MFKNKPHVLIFCYLGFLESPAAQCGPHNAQWGKVGQEMNKIEKNIKSQLRHLVNIDTNKPEQITLALHMVDLIVTRAFELKAISRATPFVAKKRGPNS